MTNNSDLRDFSGADVISDNNLLENFIFKWKRAAEFKDKPEKRSWSSCSDLQTHFHIPTLFFLVLSVLSFSAYLSVTRGTAPPNSSQSAHNNSCSGESLILFLWNRFIFILNTNLFLLLTVILRQIQHSWEKLGLERSNLAGSSLQRHEPGGILRYLCSFFINA